MFAEETVFILGAGASKPYGFPLGDELIQKIHHIDVKDLNDCVKHIKKIRDKSFDGGIIEFMSAFKRSKPMSIDAFLESSPEYADYGRRAIARIILAHENEDNIFVNNSGDAHWDDWLRPVLQTLRAPVVEVLNNRVSFVTFNYDRSLEMALLHFFANTYKGVDSLEMLRSFEIVHVYGSIGNIGQHEASYVPFTGNRYDPIDHADLARGDILSSTYVGAQNIKVISEHRDGDGGDGFQRARKLISEAQRLIFLGFAFDSINVKRLGSELRDKVIELAQMGDAGPIRLAATAYGMEQAEVNRAARLISSREMQDRVRLFLHPMKSLQMLRHTGVHIFD